MTCNHYDLEFVLQNSPGTIEETVKRLEKENRIQVTTQDKRLLRVGLVARMKVRNSKAAQRRKDYMK